MIIYKDIISGDELCSDVFDMELKGIVYEVNGKLITVGPTSVDTGANASAEGADADEGAEDGAIQAIDIVYSNRLQSTSFDKKSYLTYMKGYLKSVVASIKEKAAKNNLSEEETEKLVKTFQASAQAFIKDVILANFKDYEFYTGESMNIDGMVALLNYREDGTTPYFTFFKDGLSEMKV
ncbi:hypothetical protein H4218_000401 [Coemansia sp. IMI 209128]|nr:hypothetical protein GGI10_000837 [Coemansia sp. RSA 2530]KAJ2703116.1 hypothetical protein H4218_000401 [Coemansia sp. IMI 209128]